MEANDQNEQNNDGDVDMGVLHDDVAIFMVEALGGNGRAYARERRTAANRIVAEMYSPPRVTAMIKAMPSLGLVPGFALDLTTNDEEGQPWDFNSYKMRQKARHLLETTKPMLLVGSPMCTAFCTWQKLNEAKIGGEQLRRARHQAIMHVNFMVQMYEI
jgi:hypothetical protein